MRVVDAPMAFESGKWLFKGGQTVKVANTGNFVMYVNIPHNPTGSGYTMEEWTPLLKWAQENSAILIVDEAYIDLVYKEGITSVLNVPGWQMNCIVLQSVSKGYNATGLRFGWVVGHPTIIKALRKVMDVKDSGMFAPSIVSGLTCLQNPQWKDGIREHYLELHKLLAGVLSGAGFTANVPDAGLCQFTPAPVSIDGVVFENAEHCTKWLRENYRISLMHYTVDSKPWLRWAVTVKPVVECNLPGDVAVIKELANRLGKMEISF